MQSEERWGNAECGHRQLSHALESDLELRNGRGKGAGREAETAGNPNGIPITQPGVGRWKSAYPGSTSQTDSTTLKAVESKGAVDATPFGVGDFFCRETRCRLEDQPTPG